MSQYNATGGQVKQKRDAMGGDRSLFEKRKTLANSRWSAVEVL